MIHRELEALRQLEAIGRTSFRAQIAKHASRRVEDEGSQYLLLVYFVAVANLAAYRAYLDAIDRTGQRAKIARDAERRSIFRIQIQPGRATKPLRHARRLERILFGIDSLIRVASVARLVHRTNVVPERDHQTFEQIYQ